MTILFANFWIVPSKIVPKLKFFFPAKSYTAKHTNTDTIRLLFESHKNFKV